MKIFRINSHYNNTNFLQKVSNENYSEKKLKINDEIISLGVGLCVFFLGALLIYKSAKSSLKTVSDFEKSLSQADKKFYNNIIDSLRAFGIDVKIDSLQSIVAPDAFSELIKKFKPEHFNAGLQISQATLNKKTLDEFYKNAVEGNFRVSLHTHSNFSDGKATVEEFLDNAVKYADKVAAMNKNDGLPPLTIALTDHDSIKGCQEIIKLIAKEPNKYKNLKFVSGCEFSVQRGDKHHDVTGLALNPFDKNLIKVLSDLSEARKKIIQEFLDKQPEFNGKKISYNDLAEYEKQHYKSTGKGYKHCIENISGLVSVRHAVKFYYKMTGQAIDYDMMNVLGNKKILPIEQVVNTIKENGGYASLTHPIKSFWCYIGDDELLKLKNMGISGIEVNHQYSPSKITKLGKIHHNIDSADSMFKELTQKYKDFAEKNGMFLSGGTDSHEKQIFSREPFITSEFLNEKILKP